jgi:hypothetical protein
MTAAQVNAEAALGYQAPFLVKKLVKDRIADTEEEAERLFAEVKRFIVLVRHDTETTWDMYSRRVDEAWHQFVLFTREYIDFSLEYFGNYVQHSPGIATPTGDGAGTNPENSPCFHDFKKRYEEFYGIPLPDVWYDARSVTKHRRVLNDDAGKQLVREANGRINLLDDDETVVISVSGPARDALKFVASTGTFYVRELPGDLSDEEKIGLIAALVEHGVLRVGP